ncbi:uncharacterized protein [Lolium perenne]|uniref:uncharacterized protein isoform X1 n=1 Tax=Lolium perenne TaxID=4522 RepID=UPI003A99C61C
MLEEEQEAALDEENIGGSKNAGGGMPSRRRRCESASDGALLKRERLLRRRPKISHPPASMSPPPLDHKDTSTSCAIMPDPASSPSAALGLPRKRHIRCAAWPWPQWWDMASQERSSTRVQGITKFMPLVVPSGHLPFHPPHLDFEKACSWCS